MTSHHIHTRTLDVTNYSAFHFTSASLNNLTTLVWHRYSSAIAITIDEFGNIFVGQDCLSGVQVGAMFEIFGTAWDNRHEI